MLALLNEVAIDVAKCAFPGKVMKGSPCLAVGTLSNENGRLLMKLNDTYVTCNILVNCDNQKV